MSKYRLAIAVLVGMALGACTATAPVENLDEDETSPVINPSGAVTTIVPSPEIIIFPDDEIQLSYDSVLYSDEEAGIELDYPAGWNEGYGERQSRAYFQTYFSWDPSVSDSIEFVPAGGTYMQIEVALWEPTNDLDAYVEWQSQSLEGSRNEFLSKEAFTTADGGSGVLAVVQAVDGSKVFFFFWMAIGERYLTITGEGDLQLLTEIVSTVRVFVSSDSP